LTARKVDTLSTLFTAADSSYIVLPMTAQKTPLLAVQLLHVDSSLWKHVHCPAAQQRLPLFSPLFWLSTVMSQYIATATLAKMGLEWKL
jgi:hypothetical protein